MASSPRLELHTFCVQLSASWTRRLRPGVAQHQLSDPPFFSSPPSFYLHVTRGNCTWRTTWSSCFVSSFQLLFFFLFPFFFFCLGCPTSRFAPVPQGSSRRSRSTSAGIQRRDIGTACSNLGDFAASSCLREYQALWTRASIPPGAPDLPESNHRRVAADRCSLGPPCYPLVAAHPPQSRCPGEPG